MEKHVSNVSWLHGLENYFEFTGNSQAKEYVSFVLKLHYANNPVVSINNSGSSEEFLIKLNHYAPDDLFKKFGKFYREGYNPAPLRDAFARSQVKSKIWLSEELKNITSDLGNVALFAGWYGHHTLFLKDFNLDSLRNFDADLEACLVSDYVFNLDEIEDYVVKSVNTNLDDITVTKSGHQYNVQNFTTQKKYNEKIKFDTIVNTSSEHMDTNWFFQLKFKELNPLVVIQSNNLFDIPEHVNCVYSIDHMKKVFPMQEIYFEGEKQLQGYKRFMLIGRP